MGSNRGDKDEEPIHTVFLENYLIDRTEVTNVQFVKFLNDQGNQEQEGVRWLDADANNVLMYQIEGRWHPKDGYSNHPVIGVNWYGAKAYCEWAGKRLPTEAEWEKAARGGLEDKQYPWGDQRPSCNLSVINGAQIEGCEGKTLPVGSFSANGYGLYNVVGNVREWVEDWYEPYPESEDQDLLGYDQGQRIMRGGSWYYGSFYLSRIANRGWSKPEHSHEHTGFRCAADILVEDN